MPVIYPLNGIAGQVQRPDPTDTVFEAAQDTLPARKINCTLSTQNSL